MGLIDFFRRRSPVPGSSAEKKSPAEPRTKPSQRDESSGPQTSVPPSGIWIYGRCKVPPGDWILFTYHDPEAGSSAKGGAADNPGSAIDMTFRFPGGCDSWVAVNADEVKRLLLPIRPWWMELLPNSGTERVSAPGTPMPTRFDIAVQAKARQIELCRNEWKPKYDAALAAYRAGRLDDAEHVLKSIEQQSRAAGDSLGQVIAIGDLGMLELARGRLDTGLKLYEQQCRLARQYGFRHTYYTALRNKLGAQVKQFSDQGKPASTRPAIDAELRELDEFAHSERKKELIEFCAGLRMQMSSEPAGQSRPWRSDPLLKPLFHTEYPDDLCVDFVDAGSRVRERMWVKLERQVTGEQGYAGRLLNQPNQVKMVCAGDSVLIRIHAGDDVPKFVRKL